MARGFVELETDPAECVDASTGMATHGGGDHGGSAKRPRLDCLVLVCSKWPPVYGGPGIYYHRLLPRMASVAKHVHIVTRRGQRPPSLDAGELPVTASAVPQPSGAVTQQLFGSRVAWHIVQQVRCVRGRAAVLFTGGNPMNGWRETAVALGASGIPVIVENVLMSGDDGPTIARCRFPGLTRLAAARIRCFCPVSTGLKRSLQHVFPRVDCQLLPYGIDLAANAPPLPAQKRAIREELGLPPHGLVAVTLGNVHERKGQLPLIQAWIEWVKKMRATDARLMIVGPSEVAAYRAELDRVLAAEPLFAHTVLFTGQVPDSRRYLSAADMYVTAARAEGLPIAIVEALAHGLPVVCRWLEGVTDDFMLGRAVTPLYDFDGGSFSEAATLMLDPASRAAASIDARRVAEQRFDVDLRLARLRRLVQDEN